MNNITTSLEVSKRLKEAGWDKECEYLYYTSDNDSILYLYHKSEIKHLIGGSVTGNTGTMLSCKAPTAEEVLRELPLSVIGSGAEAENHLVVSPRGNGKWDIYYEQADGMTKAHIIGDTIAGAAAEMWIYLKENNLLPKKT